jgi:hypothetical protein
LLRSAKLFAHATAVTIVTTVAAAERTLFIIFLSENRFGRSWFIGAHYTAETSSNPPVVHKPWQFVDSVHPPCLTGLGKGGRQYGHFDPVPRNFRIAG